MRNCPTGAPTSFVARSRWQLAARPSVQDLRTRVCLTLPPPYGDVSQGRTGSGYGVRSPQRRPGPHIPRFGLKGKRDPREDHLNGLARGTVDRIAGSRKIVGRASLPIRRAGVREMERLLRLMRHRTRQRFGHLARLGRQRCNPLQHWQVGTRPNANARRKPGTRLRRQSPAPDERHLRRHHGHSRYVCVKRQICHVEHGAGNVVGIDCRFRGH